MESKRRRREMDSTAATIIVMALVIATNSVFAYLATRPAQRKMSKITQPAPKNIQADPTNPTLLGPESLSD